ncbi:hypothetical protein SAMN04488561_1774 [Jiangella alba]|uniref:Uncharacterized protein n=1 Tax=Jiangella alba TaxID=561176 RepID=A0A1H5JWB9_9ACTN|nr:hypothetical protein SAMN04488561_1774 [Jiangella alba]
MTRRTGATGCPCRSMRPHPELLLIVCRLEVCHGFGCTPTGSGEYRPRHHQAMMPQSAVPRPSRGRYARTHCSSTSGADRSARPAAPPAASPSSPPSTLGRSPSTAARSTGGHGPRRVKTQDPTLSRRRFSHRPGRRHRRSGAPGRQCAANHLDRIRQPCAEAYESRCGPSGQRQGSRGSGSGVGRTGHPELRAGRPPRRRHGEPSRADRCPGRGQDRSSRVFCLTKLVLHLANRTMLMETMRQGASSQRYLRHGSGRWVLQDCLGGGSAKLAPGR